MIDSKSGHGTTSSAQTPNVIDTLAFAWAAKVDGAPLDPTQQASLDDWLAADARHAGAFARAMAASAYLDRSAALGPDFAAAPPHGPLRWLPPPPTRRHLLAGGALAIAAMGGGVAFEFAVGQGDRLTTAKGVIQRHPLADGSSMVLNTATAVELRFDTARRLVALESGEAWFDVVKDRSRPFLVAAGSVTVRAVGTSFSVFRHEDGDTDVIVAEGIVAVARGSAMPVVRLPAGRMMRIAGGGSVGETALSADALDRASAWLSGMIDMNGLTLGEAAVQFGRYSDARIVPDAGVATMRVAGVYSINNPLGFARDAALSLGLRTIPVDGGVRITKGA